MRKSFLLKMRKISKMEGSVKIDPEIHLPSPCKVNKATIMFIKGVNRKI